MIAVLLIIVIVLLLIAGIAFASWGATTAAIGLTLVATNAAAQTTITFLNCTLVAGLPLMLYGTYRLGMAIGERKSWSDDRAPMRPINEPETPAITSGMPSPQETQLLAPQTTPAHVMVYRSRRARRVAAKRIAQRWFG